jgi:rhodanese-related sulfurtransferase
MGPLVPYILSNEFSIIIALLVGIGFGFALEQAGFSSTKKLVGLFYGNDFTVLKVFFTAGITAMIGTLLFNHWGILDLSLVYINPTFLYSALVGGAIMGVGFIIGGFCPGTSICAAAIGKLDGMAFVAGSVLGIVAFAEGFPIFEKLYTAESWGPVLMYEKLGMSRISYAVALTAVAFLTFYFTHRIENWVNNYKSQFSRKKLTTYGIGIGMAFFVLALVIFTPSKDEMIKNRIADAKRQQKCVFKEVSADQLAFEIANNYYKINVIDVRPEVEYKAYHLPMAINIPFEELPKRQWKVILNQKLKTNYFYADTDTLAKKSCLWAKYLGKSDNFILHESSNEFNALFSSELKEPANASKDQMNVFHYRVKLTQEMNALVDVFKNMSQPVKPKEVKIKGGCS